MICGSGSVTIVAHDAVEPFVVKYFPPLPLCDGNASTVPHDVVVPSLVKNFPV
jgi:hypothetical protein